MKWDTDLTLRYYGIGAQIIKDFKVKNMILILEKEKNNRSWWFWFKNKNKWYQMKKILIINANYYNEILSWGFYKHSKKLVLSLYGVFEIPIAIRKI